MSNPNGPAHGRTRELAATTSRWVVWGPIALLAIAVLVAVQSARMGLSGLVVELAQFETDRWEAAPRTQGLAEVNRVAARFADSLDFLPDNPWALEGLGALDLRRMRLARTSKEALAFAQDARLRFRAGLRQKPTSPFLWANLALSKLFLDEVDTEFFKALKHADELGPWEPATQQIVLFAGLAAWERLDPGLKNSMVRVLERGAMRNASKMFEIVRSYRRFDLACPLTGYHVIGAKECGKTGGAAGSREPSSGGKR